MQKNVKDIVYKAISDVMTDCEEGFFFEWEDTNVDTIGCDSLDVVEIVIAIESEVGKTLPDELICSLDTSEMTPLQFVSVVEEFLNE